MKAAKRDLTEAAARRLQTHQFSPNDRGVRTHPDLVIWMDKHLPDHVHGRHARFEILLFCEASQRRGSFTFNTVRVRTVLTRKTYELVKKFTDESGLVREVQKCSVGKHSRRYVFKLHKRNDWIPSKAVYATYEENRVVTAQAGFWVIAKAKAREQFSKFSNFICLVSGVRGYGLARRAIQAGDCSRTVCHEAKSIVPVFQASAAVRSGQAGHRPADGHGNCFNGGSPSASLRPICARFWPARVSI